MNKITKVIARQVFDSRGNPTVEAEVFTKNLSASAICPSGASTGTYEAFEKRDKNNKRYLGKSVMGAINLVNTKISKKLKGSTACKLCRFRVSVIKLKKLPKMRTLINKRRNLLSFLAHLWHIFDTGMAHEFTYSL